MAASLPVLDTVLYRLECTNVHSDWGRNRTSFCAGPLRDSLTGIGTAVIITAAVAAALGALVLGVVVWSRSRARGSRPTRGTVVLIGCATMYSVALVCEAGRVLSLGLGLDSAIGLAPLSAGVIFAVWMAATGIATVVIAVVEQERQQPTSSLRTDAGSTA